MFNWKEYINATKNKPPRQLLVRALSYVKNKNLALDLGAGALNDSKYLLEKGFKRVISIDIVEDLELSNSINNERFIFEKIGIEDYEFSESKFDLINAQFVLPFINKGAIVRVISNIKNSLKSDGIFLGQFFGTSDSWSNMAGVNVYTKKEIQEFLLNLDILYFQEEEKDGQTAMEREKHWHIFHFIAKKG